jgi:hypothetical protein
MASYSKAQDRIDAIDVCLCDHVDKNPKLDEIDLIMILVEREDLYVSLHGTPREEMSRRLKGRAKGFKCGEVETSPRQVAKILGLSKCRVSVKTKVGRDVLERDVSDYRDMKLSEIEKALSPNPEPISNSDILQFAPVEEPGVNDTEEYNALINTLGKRTLKRARQDIRKLNKHPGGRLEEAVKTTFIKQIESAIRCLNKATIYTSE